MTRRVMVTKLLTKGHNHPWTLEGRTDDDTTMRFGCPDTMTAVAIEMALEQGNHPTVVILDDARGTVQLEPMAEEGDVS